MKRNILFTVTLLVLCSALPAIHSGAQETPKGIGELLLPWTSKPPHQAFVTPDNDLRFIEDDRPFGKTVEIPPVVVRKIADAVSDSAKSCRQMADCPLYGTVIRISLPDGKFLFVPNISTVATYWYFIVYDPKTGAVSKRTLSLWNQWTVGNSFGYDLSKPLVSFADLYRDGHKQVVLEEAVHNGNMYGAGIHDYFEVEPDLSLKRVLTIESPGATVGAPNFGMWVIFRELKQLSPTELRLDSYVAYAPENEPAGSGRKHIGWVILESKGPGVPFHIKERHPLDKDWATMLITSDGDPPQLDDRFIADGYNDYY